MLDLIRKVWMFVPPVCILAGTVGNALTLITVTSKRCKKNSFVIYLGALAIADTISLYAISLNAWLLYAFSIDIMLNAISCKIFAYIGQVCKMLSSLLVATLSVDRMICICCQSKRDKFNTPNSAMIVLRILLGFVFTIHAHELYGFKLIVIGNVTLCGYVDSTYATFFDTYFTWIDTSMYFILPAIVIIAANILTIREVIKATKQASHFMNNEAVRKRIRSNRQLILMMIAVSAAFLLLTSPFGIYFIIRPYIFTDSAVFYANDGIDFLVTTICFNLGFVNFAINFFLYVISARRFREDLKAACTWWKLSRVAPAP